MREPPRRLGRGLASLLGQPHEAVSGGSTEHASQSDLPPTEAEPHSEPSLARLRELLLDTIVPNPRQPRRSMGEASLQELSASIARHGVLQPLLVRPEDAAGSRFIIVAGERRWRAARAAGLDRVPCLVQPLDEVDASLAALVENLQREDLSPLEEAEGYRTILTSYGLNHDELAAALGKSRSHVANTLRLLNLHPMVKQALEAGQITAGHARALLSHADPTRALEAVLRRGLNVRDTESLVLEVVPVHSDRGAAGESAVSATADTDTAALERQITERLGLAVRITDRGGRGRLSITFRNVDQLDGLVELLLRG